MKYDPGLAACLPSRGATMPAGAMSSTLWKTAGFRPRTSGVWWRNSMRSLTSAGWRRPSSILRTALLTLGQVVPKWSKARGRHRRRCRPFAFPHGTRGTVDHCFVSLWKEAHMEDPVPVKEEYTYQVGKIQFIVTPVYKDKGESMRDILLKLMLADLEPA